MKYFIITPLDLPSTLSEWMSWSTCSTSCISEDSFPIKMRKRCGTHGKEEKCIQESQPCNGYNTCPLGLFLSYITQFSFLLKSKFLNCDST